MSVHAVTEAEVMWKGGSSRKIAGRFAALVAASVLSGCGADGVSLGNTDPLDASLCTLDPSLLLSSLAPNAIPALTEPDMVGPASPLSAYLADDDRVLGLVVDGEARAYPHRILWWHEIINDRIGGRSVSISFCPLTGSGLAFDRELPGGPLDLGVSGLLFANNLVMYDRVTDELYGPQLGVDGRCGRFRGQSLALIPVQETSWGRWKALHPSTTVVAEDGGSNLNYQLYPYGDYDQLHNSSLVFSMSVDASRPLKERVLAIRDGGGGRGYPFGELAETGSVSALNEVVAGTPTVIFYEERDGQTAIAYDARVDGQALTFTGLSGSWTDQETGSTWGLDGMAVSGPLAGKQLAALPEAYVLFWFAWRHFQPSGTTYMN